ncbi:hypothetical protein Tco_1413597, partial [Tanacetum coccineum]
MRGATTRCCQWSWWSHLLLNGRRDTGFTFNPRNADDIFAKFFEFRGMGGGGGSGDGSGMRGTSSAFGGGSGIRKAAAIERNLPCAFEELYKGTTKKIKIFRDITDLCDLEILEPLLGLFDLYVVVNKGFPRLISHLKRLHLLSDEHKYVLREAISTDHGLYIAVEETLKEFGTEITKGLVLDAELLDRVFKVPITAVKCIPHGCRLAFSQALKITLCKVVAQPDYVDAWVRLLLFPRCALQVYRPKNRQKLRFENRKSLQQSSILKSLATCGKDDGIATLVKSILDGSASGSFGQVRGDFLEEGAIGNFNIKQYLRKVT